MSQSYCNCGFGPEDEQDKKYRAMGLCQHNPACPETAEEKDDPSNSCDCMIVDGPDGVTIKISYEELGKLLGVKDPVESMVSYDKTLRYLGRAFTDGRVKHDWIVGSNA